MMKNKNMGERELELYFADLVDAGEYAYAKIVQDKLNELNNRSMDAFQLRIEVKTKDVVKIAK